MTLSLCLMMACGLVRADELSDAQKLWDNKDFSAAFQKFGKLAAAGNSSAQLQLGEMYGFGEGTPEDASKAAYWLKQAAAQGNPEASASMEVLRQRGAHKADIAYYTTTFEGGNVAYNRFNCTPPSVPAVSKSNVEIDATNTSINAWTECYGRFVINLNGVAEPVKTIPAEILKLMSNDEFIRASRLIEKTYIAIAANAKKDAENIESKISSWKFETEKFVSERNESSKGVRAANANEVSLLNRQMNNDVDIRYKQNQAARDKVEKK